MSIDDLTNSNKKQPIPSKKGELQREDGTIYPVFVILEVTRNVRDVFGTILNIQ